MNDTIKIGCAGILAILVAIDNHSALGDDPRPPDAATIAALARLRGDAKRGALLFYKSPAACAKCHGSGKDTSPLGPDLTTIGKEVTDQHLVESILDPSKAIRKGFETVTVLTNDGQLTSGLVAADTAEAIVLRDAENLETEIRIPRAEIDELRPHLRSMMPERLADSLHGERDLYDLVRYVMEVARGGQSRADELMPDPEDLIIKDDSINLDHAGILRSLNAEDLQAGRQIYNGHCRNCHGANGNTPSLPTARAFGTQQLKFGDDPYSMMRTLTRGAGLMTAMQHLSPKERYQVVHFIRQEFMKGRVPGYQELDDGYLNSLPQGTGIGEIVIPLDDRDYGPVLGSQIGSTVNCALTFRLPDDISVSYDLFRLPDDISVSYDLHRMRLVGAWTGGFLDLTETHHYRQRGEQMPQIDGQMLAGLSHWQWAFDGSFEIPADAKTPRGPIRPDWLQYDGHYLYGDRAVLSYGIHGRKVLETVNAFHVDRQLMLQHTLRVEAGDQPLELSVGQIEGADGPSGVIAHHRASVDGKSGPASDHIAVVSKKKTDDAACCIAAALVGDSEGIVWKVDDADRIVLSIPAGDQPRVLGVIRCSVNRADLDEIGELLDKAVNESALVNPATMTGGGPQRWSQTIIVKGERGESINGYALDTIPVPFENPWNVWLRTSALDFFDDGRAVVTTHGGDVYFVSGLDDGLGRVCWKRYAAGLFEPFGVRVVNGVVYVTCRDGIKRLHDFNGDDEADFVEAFWIDDDVSCEFHAYNFDLQTDSRGNFYFAKAGQYTDHGRPGTIMRIPSTGGRADVVAWGLRTPNGMGKLNDDRFTVSDNQGPWMPAGKISLVKADSFLGSMPINDEQTNWLKDRHGGRLPETFDQPIIWTPQELDSSCGGQLWVTDQRFGPLSGRLLHSSFGKGWLYYLSLQEVKDKMQASMVALPHQWDAGVMRLRINPTDGQLYGTGLSGWQGPADGKDGCLQRLRYTGEPVLMIDRIRVVAEGLEISFNFAVDSNSAADPASWRGEMWNYLWSEQYGSDAFSILRPGEKGRDSLPITKAQLVDGKTVRLTVPDLRECDQMLLTMNFLNADGDRFVEQTYLTIHVIPPE